MNLFDLFRPKKKGRKLVDLPIDRIAENNALQQLEKQLRVERERLDLRTREYQLKMDSWWMKVKTENSLEGALHYEDGAVYELVDEN